MQAEFLFSPCPEDGIRGGIGYVYKLYTTHDCLIGVKDLQIDIRLTKVREVTQLTHLYRWEMLRLASAGSQIKVGLKAKVDLLPEKGAIKLLLTAYYTRVRGMVRRPLLDFAVETEFEVDDFMRHFADAVSGERMMDLPPSVLTMMLSVGIGALRGMIAQRTKGTPLESTPLPLINISSLVSCLIYTSPSDEFTRPFSTQICG